MSTGTWGLVASSTSSSKSDVDSGNLELLESVDDIDGCQHSRIRGGLVSVRLDLHAAGNSGQGFSAGQIGNMDEGVVPCGQDVADSEEFLILGNLRTKLDCGLLSFLCDWGFLGSRGAFLTLLRLGVGDWGRLGWLLNLGHFMDSNNLLN